MTLRSKYIVLLTGAGLMNPLHFILNRVLIPPSTSSTIHNHHSWGWNKNSIQFPEINVLCVVKLGRSDVNFKSFKRCLGFCPLYLFALEGTTNTCLSIVSDKRRRILPMFARYGLIPLPHWSSSNLSLWKILWCKTPVEEMINKTKYLETKRQSWSS